MKNVTIMGVNQFLGEWGHKKKQYIWGINEAWTIDISLHTMT